MKILSHEQIISLGISPATCVEWVRESFADKRSAQLPAKISLHPQPDDFINTMPCLLPAPRNRFGVKVVSRIAGAVPALRSLFLLYDARSGETLALMDADWITTMRTGAVAALAQQTLRRSGPLVHAFIGLGNTARATLLCMLESEPDRPFQVLLLKHKGQEASFIRRFEAYGNVSFQCVDSVRDLIAGSDVIFSCITKADDLICPDDSLFRKGCLVIPVHTRGFQNCDLFFDKVFGDDTGHIRGFRYFDRFRYFAELGDVLDGSDPGRENNHERILSYNIGLGLHDLVFADKVYRLLSGEGTEINLEKPSEKFWI
ncbi:MAG: ornithine cyclodeaminase [Bacteroidales bacterium]|nr:ornithine cyclodeaminase [Bacteroidales bacterium]